MPVNTLKVPLTDSKAVWDKQYKCYQKHVQDSSNSGNVFGNMPFWGRLLRPTGDTDYNTHLWYFHLVLPAFIDHVPRCISLKRMPGRLKKRWHFSVQRCICVSVCVSRLKRRYGGFSPYNCNRPPAETRFPQARHQTSHFHFSWTLRNGHQDLFCQKTANTCFVCLVWMQRKIVQYT